MTSAFPTPRARTQSENALSVLESAIKTFKSNVETATSQLGNTRTSEKTTTARISTRPTPGPTRSSDRTAGTKSTPTKTRVTTTATTSTPSTLSTLTASTTLYQSTAVDNTHPSLTTNTPSPSALTLGAHPSPQAYVPAVIFGVLALIAITALCIVYLLRRKKAGLRYLPFVRKSSQHSAKSGPYPQSAWLYDPVRTPGSGRTRAASEDRQNLIPTHPGYESVEMGEAGTASSDLRSTRASSLERTIGRASSPSMRKTRGASHDYGRAPSPGYEGGGRASMPLLELPRITIEDEDGDGGIEQAYERLHGRDRSLSLGNRQNFPKPRGGGIDEDGGA